MKRHNLTSFLFALSLSMLLAACGGGDDTSFPSSAKEVGAAFDAAPEILHDYFEEVRTTGHSSNPDTTMVESPVGMRSSRLVVTYKGTVIYDRVANAGFSTAHGFASDGTYLLVVNSYTRAGITSALPTFFVNGKNISLTESGELKVKEYRDGWVIFSFLVIPPYGGPVYSWSMYNYQTGRFIDYGE